MTTPLNDVVGAEGARGTRRLVLHVITMWSVAELMKREVASAAAARRTAAYQLMHGTSVPAR